MLRQAVLRSWWRIPSNTLQNRALSGRAPYSSFVERNKLGTVSYWHGAIKNVVPRTAISTTTWRANHFSTDAKNSIKSETNPAEAATPPTKRRLGDDIKEYTERVKTGNTAAFDTKLIPTQDSKVFPRIKTTSLSTKRIVIHDEAMKCSATLVMVAFRSFADDQLQSWRGGFVSELPAERVKWYDVTINESFGAQALSGFIQRLQRGWTDAALHDYSVAFNSRAREPLESLLPSANRMFGYVLLLDREARVRFRASGMATQEGLEALLRCTRELIEQDKGAMRVD